MPEINFYYVVYPQKKLFLVNLMKIFPDLDWDDY